MATHSDIIDRVGPVPLAEKLGVKPLNIYQWRKTNSIPGGYWDDLVSQELAEYPELGKAARLRRIAASKKRRKSKAPQ